MKNIDKKTVEGFGDEWHKFNQSSIPEDDLKKAWLQYFDIFPFNDLTSNSEGFDMGCGSGRWAKFVAPRVSILNCIDPSKKALLIAEQNLSMFSNIRFFHGSVSDEILQEGSQDFGYCLGVLHHVPDTLNGIKASSKLLKKGAPFLIYLYYNFENRSFFFKLLWQVSNLIRRFISVMPRKTKMLLTDFIAYFVYYPLARIALVCEKIGINVSNFPLTDYRNKPFYFMKTDSLDRFGTRLEKRFSKDEIKTMLSESGFRDIKFSEKMPHWVAIAYKK